MLGGSGGAGSGGSGGSGAAARVGPGEEWGAGAQLASWGATKAWLSKLRGLRSWGGDRDS